MGQELTNKIKASLMNYYTFKVGAALVCTELWDGFSIADFIAIVKNNIIEIEIKISVSDLKNELKKGREKYEWVIEGNDPKYNLPIYKKGNIELITKHKVFNNSNIYTSPNKYYFCVPEYMLKETLTFAEKLNPKYGVIVFVNNKYIINSLSVAKRAYNLHSENNVDKYKPKMLDRICNDLTKKYRLLYYCEDK